MKTLVQIPKRGFALVVTLSLMVLLVLLAVGLLNLSTISLRGSSQGSAQAEARANARLALMMALGQLQKDAGDDRRISRTADQIPADGDATRTAAVPGRRFWTGIYNAWDDELEKRPAPGFRGWLVSHPNPTSANEKEPTLASGAQRMIQLVAAGTAGASDEDRVEAPAIDVNRNGRLSGRLAWWTGDQGVKAMLATPPVEPAKSLAEVRGRLQAAPSHAMRLASTTAGQPFRDLDRSDFRLDALTDWPQASFLATDRDSPKELFHDLATRTSGLLVNVREGGFRRDLSMKFELTTRNPNPTTLTPLYKVNGEEGINFEELVSHYKLYQKLEPLTESYTTGGSIPRGTLGLRLAANANACMSDEYFHYKMPVIVSYQAVFSLQARPVGPASNQRSQLYFVVDPIITFWNPLDVPVVVPRTAFFSVKYWSFPYTMTVTTGAGTFQCPLISSLSGATTSNNRDFNYLSLRAGELDQLVFKPGEVIKVSQSGDLKVKGTGTDHNLQGRPGFNFGGGVSQPLLDLTGRTLEVANRETVRYTLEPNRYTCGQRGSSGHSLTGGNAHTRHFSLNHHEVYVGSDRGGDSLGIGNISIDWDFGNQRVRPGSVRESGTPGTKPLSDRIYADQSGSSAVFPRFTATDTRPLPVSLLLSSKAPVMMYSYQVKTETTSETGTRTMLRFNPRAHHVDFYSLAEAERDLLPYELVVEPLVSWVNRKLETSPKGNAYYGGGYDAADGTSSVVTHSVPHEPLVSLAALQHSTANGFIVRTPQYGYASLNAREPMLPQVSHAIGNSFAPAVMSSDQTSRLAPGNRPLADHSYLANRELWDGWFFSSISPQETSNFARRRAQRQVAQDFLDGTQDLPIPRYRPDLRGRGVTSVLNELFSGAVPKANAVDLVGSLIRVDGMFNVNSTSVEAWRALLASLLGEDIITRDDTGKLSRTTVADGVPVTGLSAPLDAKARGKGSVANRDPEQWTGRRVLTDEEITLLAEAIVREVRKRGPFLSLADFVNRRVGSDPALARAGVIQSALDSDEVPVNEAYNKGARAVANAVAKRLPFPEAEEGAASAGIPGIVKQADILTPLAPILSARSDSFLIRAYGEAVDAGGRVTARAWCEALVERDAAYIEVTDPRETRPDDLKSPVNKSMGRRFLVTSFRWLDPREI